MAKTDISERITPWICQISRMSIQYIGREMGRLGFGPGQFFFLTELFRNDGLRQDELSRRVGVDKSNTSRALSKLEKYGLVRRESDADNHRAKKVYLEPKALEVREEFFKIQDKWNAELLDGLSQEVKQQLLLNLKKMAANAEKSMRENVHSACAICNRHGSKTIRTPRS